MKLHLSTGRWVTYAIIAVVAIVAAVMLVRGRHHAATVDVPVQPVQRQDIQVTIDATGTVEPIDLVEVKSKASGQIVKMPVAVGSVVRAGDLLAQIDKVDVQNQYDQAYAALRAAQAKADISQSQKKRSDDLFGQGIITADEHEAATIDFANSQAALVKARTDLDSARQRLADATVRAPVAGTVLQQLVTVGQVIASATSSVSGGTSLLQMADLSRIRLRALVAETDIGSVQPGQTATVTVDAFPQRPFAGVVEKIEPQAVVQQSVTMFPVLISISNERGLLLPGMNGEVSMLIAERDGVLAVPLDAVRTVRELPAVALALGLPADPIVANVRKQLDARASRVSADSGRSGGPAAGNLSADPAGGARAGGRDSSLARGRGRRAFGDSASRARWMAGGGARGMRGGRGAGAGAGAGGGLGASGASGGASGSGGFGASGTGGFGAAGSGGGAAGGRGGRAQVVFVKTATGLEPRLVRLGLSNYDFVEVLEGVREGEQVALLSVAELQAKRQQDQDRLRQRMSSGMPGVATPGGGRGGGGAGGGGGGAGGGGAGGGGAGGGGAGRTGGR